MSVLALIPWALFALMAMFGAIFAILAWRYSGNARKAISDADRLRAALAEMEARAQHAESQIAAAQQRAQAAEQRIAEAEARAQDAERRAQQAEQRARDAEQRASGALADAQRADSQLQQRRDAASEKARKATARARSLLDWARQQWVNRQENDRSRAQGTQGSFQAQLDAYLQYRRAPVTFRLESEVDQMAGPQLQGMATNETVTVEGQDVKIGFPVDPALGFRA